MMSGAILGLILICIVALNHFFKPKRKNLPPGPRGLPLLGNVLDFGEFPHIALAKWAKQYGDIFQCKYLTRSIVIINHPTLLKEVFQNSTCAGRMTVGPPWDLFNDGVAYGLLNAEGKDGETIRRFTLKSLKNFGLGKNSMEHSIMEEVKETIRLMKFQEAKPIADIKERLSVGVINSLWTILAGKRYSQDDPRVIKLANHIIKVVTNLAKSGNVLIFFPWIKYIFPEWSAHSTIRKGMDDVVPFLTETLNEHKAAYDENDQKDFMDMFLNKIQKTSDPKNTCFYGESAERHIITTAADLFGAGMDTTSGTLTWIFLYMATFPKIQANVQREIQEVTKNSRHCSLTDRPNMPYTEAFIAESLRYSSFLPVGVPHKALVDTEVRGYFIPKDTVVMQNLHYIHFNPEIWGDPETFRPERFLTEDGKVFKKHEALMPFSIGRRQCIGEALAKDTLFLFTTNVFQTFTVEFDPTEPNPDLAPVPGFFLGCKPYKIVMNDRTNDN